MSATTTAAAAAALLLIAALIVSDGVSVIHPAARSTRPPPVGEDDCIGIGDGISGYQSSPMYSHHCLDIPRVHHNLSENKQKKTNHK